MQNWSLKYWNTFVSGEICQIENEKQLLTAAAHFIVSSYQGVHSSQEPYVNIIVASLPYQKEYGYFLSLHHSAGNFTQKYCALTLLLYYLFYTVFLSWLIWCICCIQQTFLRYHQTDCITFVQIGSWKLGFKCLALPIGWSINEY